MQQPGKLNLLQFQVSCAGHEHRVSFAVLPDGAFPKSTVGLRSAPGCISTSLPKLICLLFGHPWALPRVILWCWLSRECSEKGCPHICDTADGGC